MNAPTGKVGFVKACRDFFGLKPGETLAEFAAELKALTDKDKQDLVAEFKRIGWDVELGAATAAA